MNESQELRWRGWLQLELEAVWLYPIIAARFDDLAEDATRAYDAHRDLRDDLLAVFAEAEIDPATTPVSYDVDLSTSEKAKSVAAELERLLCAAIAMLSGEVEGNHREEAITALRASALRAIAWGAEPEPFPGLD